MLSTDPEVLQNCTGFTLCNSAGLAVGECYAVRLIHMYPATDSGQNESGPFVIDDYFL